MQEFKETQSIFSKSSFGKFKQLNIFKKKEVKKEKEEKVEYNCSSEEASVPFFFHRVATF